MNGTKIIVLISPVILVFCSKEAPLTNLLKSKESSYHVLQQYRA
jgi:hypothetical protein